MTSKGKIIARNVFNTSVTSDNISRRDLVDWVNGTLDSQLTKVEELGTGEAYCQLNHLLFPSSINMKKIKFGSKQETCHLQNFKLLQDSLGAVGIQKPISIERLVKQKFQDNFEFAQWYKKFFDANYSGGEYDAEAVRGGQKLGEGKKIPGKLALKRKQVQRVAPPKDRRKEEDEVISARDGGRQHSTMSGGEVDDSVVEEMQQLTIKRLQKQISDHKLEVEAAEVEVQGAEKEREFYFGKLRAVEELCQDEQETKGKNRSFAEQILKILYATEDGFEVPEKGE